MEFCTHPRLACEGVRSELANVTSERDFLVERLRELASEWATEAARVTAVAEAITAQGRKYNAARLVGVAGGLNNAADQLTRIVTEATTGRNVTATREEDNAPTDSG